MYKVNKEDYSMGEITKIKVNGDPESSYQLYPRNEEFAKRAGSEIASSSSVLVTLIASGWDADTKAQTVSVSGVAATSNGSLRIAQSATDEQFTAWGAAQPRVTAQANNSITVTLSGTVPKIDIPVEVLII